MASINEIFRLLDQNADYALVLERFVDSEDAAIAEAAGRELQDWERIRPDGLPEAFGLEPQELGVRAAWLNPLVFNGVLELVYRSKSHTPYRLVDRDLVRKALEAWKEPEARPPEDEEIPSDLFDLITGHEDVKYILKLSLLAPRPVHVLVAGPPATAKTLFLEELRRLPGVRYADGALTTKAGLVEVLLRESPRYLLVDQIDNLPLEDQQALLGVMATGRVARLHRYDQRDELRYLWVFATANETKRLSWPLLDRFQRVEVEAYSRSEFEAVCRRFLVEREGADTELASYIARRVAETGSIRYAQRLARLASGVDDVDKVLSLSFPVEYADAHR